MSGLLGAFVVEVVLITWRGAHGGIKVRQEAPIPAPLPSQYTSAVIVYGALGLVPKSLSPLPSLIGWGFVVATFLNLFNPGAANAAQASNATLAQQLKAGPSGLATK